MYKRQVIRRINAPAKKGVHRVAWDLHYPSTDAIRSTKLTVKPEDEPKGLMAAPGQYTASIIKMADGKSTELSAPQTFTVKRLREGSLKGSTPEATAAFWRELEAINLDVSGISVLLKENQDKLKRMTIALSRSQSEPGELDKQLHDLSTRLQLMSKKLNGDPLRNEVGEKSKQTIGSRISVAAMGTRNSTYGPTAMHKQSLNIAKNQLKELKAELLGFMKDQIPGLEQKLTNLKAPYVKGVGVK